MNDWRTSRFPDPHTEVLANYLPIGRIGRNHVNLHISLTTVDPVSLPDPPAHSVDHAALDNPFRELHVAVALQHGSPSASPWFIGGGFAPRELAAWLGIDPPTVTLRRGIAQGDADRVADLAAQFGSATYHCAHQDISVLGWLRWWKPPDTDAPNRVAPCALSGFRYHSARLYRPITDAIEHEVRGIAGRLRTVDQDRR